MYIIQCVSLHVVYDLIVSYIYDVTWKKNTMSFLFNSKEYSCWLELRFIEKYNIGSMREESLYRGFFNSTIKYKLLYFDTENSNETCKQCSSLICEEV